MPAPRIVASGLAALLAAAAGLFLLAAGLAATPAGAAETQRRMALVIGNDDYESVARLEKAVNDAEAVSEHLTAIGFRVTLARDIGRRAMSRAVLEFEKTLEAGDVALFYYAGHGFSISGQDFLLPVDIPEAGPGDESLVRDEAFLTNDLADRFLRAGAATAIIILDACRDNPFAQPGKRSIAGTAGLANQPLGEGIFVLYSAGQYQSALDSLGPGDTDRNSVFTRAFLRQLEKPNASIIDIAKATQLAVRDMAKQIGHEQLPSYYDQILGNVVLNPSDEPAGAPGATQDFEEGATVAMLPRVDPAPKEGKATPIANFTRSNAGWQVNISLPEPAIQFGYRVGRDGEFVDTGTMANIDQRTGLPMPVTWFVLPPDQPAGEIYVTWRDRRGEEAGVFPIRFDPDSALKSGQKQILDQMWTTWISFREYQGLKVYFTQLISFRCAVDKVEYALDESGAFEVWPLPPCDPANPHAVPQDAKILRDLPGTTKSLQVVVTWFDGTRSPVRNFNVQF